MSVYFSAGTCAKSRLALERELDGWLAGFRNSVGVKRPDELRVLYLCGPQPLNDLNEMLAHGINPHNVWAVEGTNSDFQAPVKQPQESGTPLKVHRGSLGSFFDSYPSSFDIIYFDACGPFLGGKPSTLSPLLSILLHARLEPLSALITNFAEVPREQSRSSLEPLVSNPRTNRQSSQNQSFRYDIAKK